MDWITSTLKGTRKTKSVSLSLLFLAHLDVHKLQLIASLTQVQIEDCVIKVQELVNVLIQMVIHTLVVMDTAEQEIEGIVGMQFRHQ